MDNSITTDQLILSVTTKSSQHTSKIAQQLSKILVLGDNVFLDGDLGSGKTLFSKSICASFDIPTQKVRSSTFNIISIYTEGKADICHIDLYRITYQDEVLRDVYEYCENKDYITVIEWSNRLASSFKVPLHPLQIVFDYTDIEEERVITFYGDAVWRKKIDGIK